MDNDEIDLSPLIRYNAELPFLTSPASSPAKLPQVQQRPISKRRGKKRSSRACSSCRTRKVRCNIVAHGAPCSNCRHDEIDCVLPLSRRQRSARERTEKSLQEWMCGSQGSGGRTHSTEVQHSHSAHESCQSSSQTISNMPPHGMDISEHPLAEILPINSMCQCPTPIIGKSSIPSMRTISWIQIQSPLATAPIHSSSSSSNVPDTRLPAMPPIFTAFPKHLDTADLAYLHQRDALTLPSEAFQIALLKSYKEFVYPEMPIVDLEDFLSAVKYGFGGSEVQQDKCFERETANKKQIPFLLFQAVMFAGVGYVSMAALKEAGFESREAARRALFSRVRLLYDFDTTIDRHTIIQALLLMTLNIPPSPHAPVSTYKDTKDAYHYLGLAISLSFSLGINRTLPQPGSPNSPAIRKMRLERRIWWTAFTRDRILAMDANGRWSRPVRIRREDCDVEMLRLKDFGLHEEEMEYDGELESMKRKRDATAFVEKARLCWCSSDVLMSKFSGSCFHPSSSTALTHAQPQNVFIPQIATQQAVEDLHQSYISTSESLHTPIFETTEEAEYNMASSSSPSVDSDCITPREEDEIFLFNEEVAERGKVVGNNELDAGFGVDGEYDDYLEYLKGSILEGEEAEGKERELGECRAWQLDCENGRVAEV